MFKHNFLKSLVRFISPQVLSIAPLAALAIGRGAFAIGKRLFGGNKKPPKFRNTSFGRRLQQVGQQGRISPLARKNILDRTSTVSSNIAQKAQTSFLGRLESAGIGRSVAGLRGLNEIELKNADIIASASKDIETENELTKAQAKTEFARNETGFADRIRTFENQRKNELFEGLGGAALDFLGSTVDKGPVLNAVNAFRKDGDEQTLLFSLLQQGLTNEQILAIMDELNPTEVP